ncbi:sulfur carrier protein ThiS [Thalassotalea piscium]|uniref:Sulfur carrier protein n=1 Tax=Thalassotalea piscium TaxID=1230533 RepID=A0A7X0NEQ8_9GAMM|nr:sulfur carrier protein ThiS [Thalassotalea piscium]MBB6542096.1 sulfur carrier protein [Thalassotalea piscium]
MRITVNDKELVTDADSLVDILQLYGAKPPFAVAINGEFVAKSTYGTTQIKPNDLIDIVSPIFGG